MNFNGPFRSCITTRSECATSVCIHLLICSFICSLGAYGGRLIQARYFLYTQIVEELYIGGWVNMEEEATHFSKH